MKTPYWDRSELERIQTQWHKLTGLHSREEWSAAIVRAATAAELAANFAIRAEFAARSQFNTDFVNSMLLWANGLAGKIDRLLIPLTADLEKTDPVRGLKQLAETINAKRNSIAHRGEFCNPAEATAIIEQTRTFVQTLVRLYEPEFALIDKP